MKHRALIIGFLSGLALMSVELSATRVLAPLTGTSIYTWTSIIGMILLGLAIGSFFGGYLADRIQNLKLLSAVLILAALSVSLVPAITNILKNIIPLELPLTLIILIYSFLVFLPPAAVLGAVYPILLKVQAKNTDSIGVSAGTLSAIVTIGNITGVFLTGFFFIETLGTVWTFYILSLVLLLSAFLNGTTRKLIIAAAVIITVAFFLKQNNANAKLVFEKESAYYKIQVVDTPKDSLWGEARMLFLDLDSHSVESRSGKKLNIYTEIYPIFKNFISDLHDIYLIGGGSYSLAKNFARAYPSAAVTVAELDPEVTKVAEEFFGLRDYPIKTINGDARIDLNSHENQHDLIFGDAYNSHLAVPWHLTTYEFNETVKKRLRDEGIYAVNIISTLEGPGSLFFQSMYRTLQKSFPNLMVFVYGSNPQLAQNIVFLANSGKPFEANSIPPEFKEKYRAPQNLSFSDGVVLRDDYAPVEQLLSPLVNQYFPQYANFYYSLIR